ncbi:hypothetical protein T484DRAFT_1828398, partial [Baffinella frigidus]
VVFTGGSAARGYQRVIQRVEKIFAPNFDVTSEAECVVFTGGRGEGFSWGVVFTGGGAASKGAREIFALLPHTMVA